MVVYCGIASPDKDEHLACNREAGHDGLHALDARTSVTFWRRREGERKWLPKPERTA